MQKAEPQHRQAQQHQPAAKQAKAASVESPQGEHIAQLEAMMDSSPQAEKLGGLAAMMNNSPAMAAQRKLFDSIHNSPRQVAQKKAFDAIHNNPHQTAQRKKFDSLFGTAQRVGEEEPLQGKFDAAQRVEEEEPIQHKLASDTPAQLAPAEKRPNNTGLPDNLKSGIENLSGMSMDNVKVHYNSSQPAQLNALAYAQGTDIHVAPGQEQHLPHEAWHVVQQAQGRVQPTMQMKGGVPVNDDAGLEHEADTMGEKASAYSASGAERSSRNIPLHGTVLQARLPELTRNQIVANPDVVREILLHSIRNLGQGELGKLLNALNEGAQQYIGSKKVGLNDYVEVISETQNGLTLVEAYNYLREYMEKDKHFIAESSKSQSPSKDIESAIAIQLPQIVKKLHETMANDPMLKKVFGTEDLTVVKKIYSAAADGIKAHIDGKTCPIVIPGNSEHNAWVGVGGMTKHGSPTVELAPKLVQSLASGQPSGAAALVHEFTHAKGNTEDHAYDRTGCKKLGPKKRVNNATTYEHGYLEACGVQDEAHYYDATIASGRQRTGQETPLAALRRKKAGEVVGLIAAVWNGIDNCYMAAQRLVDDVANPSVGNRSEEKEEKTSSTQRDTGGGNARAKKDKVVDRLFVGGATFPYRIYISETNASNGDMILALIEERTRALNQLEQMDNLKEGIKSIAESDLKQWEAIDVLAELMKTRVNLRKDATTAWLWQMEDPKRLL